MNTRNLSELRTKIIWAWRQGVLGEKIGILFRRGFVHPILLWWRLYRAYLRLARVDRQLPLRQGLADHRKSPTSLKPSADHLKRVIASYKAMKLAQVKVSGPFEIRGQWGQWWVADNFKPLVRALMDEDIAALQALFDNMHRDRFAIGIGTSYEEECQRRFLNTRNLYFRTVWCRYRDILLSYGFDAKKIHAPLMGNPMGIAANDDILTINNLRHLHHASEICEWLRDVPQATVVEIGGGYGDQAFQTIRLSEGQIGKYVIFDLPEVAAIAACFLLTTLPDKRIRLYGEGPVSIDDASYDAAVFPHFAIDELPDRSVDLYHNACSFSEMDSASSLEYLRIIERTCKNYFSHVNHETPFTFLDEDGSTSVNVIGSKLVPNPQFFKRCFKKPRVFVLPDDTLQKFVSYEYLYERI